MATNKKLWKKGRGKLGALSPLIGSWLAEADSPIGKVSCTRTFESILGGNYVQLNAEWNFAKSSYKEHAIFGVRDGAVSFWSFTSDGKKSAGCLADGTDVHPEAVCFEAQMPGGLARMVYWPSPEGGFHWAVESKTQKGWNRFTEHHYRAAN